MDSPQSTLDFPAMPPPAGVVPNFANPVSHDKAIIAFHTVCIILITMFLAMRLYTRHFINHWLTWDDCKLHP